MARPNLKKLREEAQSIYSEYGARFAGKPRATRDIQALDSIIERLEKIIKRARTLRNGKTNPALSSFLEQALENLETYENERENIQKVQSQGPVVVEGSRLATWANLHFGQYFRHFAGKPRATRDLGLLNEIISELELVESKMKGLLAQKDVASVEADLETVQKNLEVYEGERENIMSARKSGGLDEQASYLAMVANEQFAVYNFHFGGRPRVSRRSGLLHRVIATLQSVRDQMSELENKGLDSEQNRNNIALIDGQLKTYRNELDKIDEARRQTAPKDLVGQLGSAANWAMAQYNENFAGQDRASRDLELLSRVCDEMLDVGRQMRELSNQLDNRANEENLVIVLDNLMLYQNEYEEIQQVQAG
jgi:hypothetical protein